MPVPIICLEASLRQYVDAFREVFSRPQFQHFVTVLLGLVTGPERRTLSGFRRGVAGTRSLSALSRFLSMAPWDPQDLARAWLARFRRQLLPQIQVERERQRSQRPRRPGRPRKPRVQAFVCFDDSVVSKAVQGKPGRRMAGVGRHYSSTEKRVVQGHSSDRSRESSDLVAGLLVLLGRRCPLFLRLYRPKAVAIQEGVPFKSKVDLVVEAVGELEPIPGTQIHVLVDAWYTCHRLWRAALDRGFAITGGLRVNRWLRLGQPGQWRKVRLSDYVAGLSPQDFVLVPWRGHFRAAHLVRTFVYHLGACQVLAVKETPETPPQTARCWATSDLEADVATVASYAAQRWDIETWFEDTKGALGLDHYQLTSATAVERFWHLVACLYLHLDEVRASLVAEGYSTATIGDALRHQQRSHRRLLFQWIAEQFKDGTSPTEVERLLPA